MKFTLSAGSSLRSAAQGLLPEVAVGLLTAKENTGSLQVATEGEVKFYKLERRCSPEEALDEVDRSSCVLEGFRYGTELEFMLAYKQGVVFPEYCVVLSRGTELILNYYCQEGVAKFRVDNRFIKFPPYYHIFLVRRI